MRLGTPTMVEQMVHFFDTSTPSTIFEFAQTNLVAQASFHFCYHNWRKKTLILKFDGNFNITIDNEHNEIRTQNLKTPLRDRLLCNVHVLTIMP
jgi:hypothetical protein